jgi:hypothetical protein
MTMIKESTEQILTKCSRLKTRDYHRHAKNTIDQLEHLVLTLENERLVVYRSLQPLVDIIQTILSSIDQPILWKSKRKVSEQQLAQIVCRLFKCLCQLDAECAGSEQGTVIIHSILQWLRDDTDFYLTKSSR